MDVKATVNISIIKEDRSYVFSMPVGAPFGQAYDAAFEVLVKISNMAKEAAEAAKSTNSPEIPQS